MLSVRVIPILLCSNGRLFKSVKFRNHRYVGDPINAVRIFNEKEVDELVLLDITATPQNRKPDFRMIGEIASECFMPICYGGGLTGLQEIEQILRLGVEKVSINTAAVANPNLIKAASDHFGSQSIVVSVDVRKTLFGKYQVCTLGGKRRTRLDPVVHCRRMEELGAGEILLNSIDRDGTMAGYDIDLLRSVSSELSIPLIASGGAGRVDDFAEAICLGRASAVAAGSMFVFHGRHRAVLIHYPDTGELRRLAGLGQ